MTLLRRLVGVLLVLAGGAALALGLWFHNFLGPGGMARFSVEPVGSTPIVIEPSVLNRTSLPVTISVTPATGSTASIVVGTPTCPGTPSSMSSVPSRSATRRHP